jgi:membrane-associated phospholipid phosphatase
MTSSSVPSSAPLDSEQLEQRQEERQRFRRLRLLIRDEPRRHRLLFRTSLLGLGIFAGMAYATHQLQTLPFDLDATLTLQGIQLVPFRQAMIGVSMPGYYPWSVGVLVTTCLALGMLLGWKESGYVALVVWFQGVTNGLIKAAIGRARPADTLVQVVSPAQGGSFPSGHVMFYTVFFGFLFFLAWTRLPRSPWRTLALLLAGGLVLLVGPSRIYLGAHWLSDVLAGHLIGLMILAFAIEFYLKYVAPRSPREEQGLIGAHDQALEPEG